MQYLLFWEAMAVLCLQRLWDMLIVGYQIIDDCSVMLKWHFLTFLGFSLFFFFSSPFRPSTKCGPDLGETVLGREAECSRGAAADV